MNKAATKSSASAIIAGASLAGNWLAAHSSQILTFVPVRYQGAFGAVVAAIVAVCALHATPEQVVGQPPAPPPAKQ